MGVVIKNDHDQADLMLNSTGQFLNNKHHTAISGQRDYGLVRIANLDAEGSLKTVTQVALVAAGNQFPWLIDWKTKPGSEANLGDLFYEKSISGQEFANHIQVCHLWLDLSA